MKLCPEYAGRQYPDLVELAYRKREEGTEPIWLSLCWEYGVLLGADQAWRKQFAEGLDRIGGEVKKRYRKRSGSELNDLFWRGLEYLNHLEQDLYPPESASICLDLEVASKPEDTAKPQVYSDPESERLYLPESTLSGLGLRIADGPKDSDELYTCSNSGQGKRNPLGAASKLLRPFVMQPKPAALAAGVR